MTFVPQYCEIKLHKKRDICNCHRSRYRFVRKTEKLENLKMSMQNRVEFSRRSVKLPERKRSQRDWPKIVTRTSLCKPEESETCQMDFLRRAALVSVVYGNTFYRISKNFTNLHFLYEIVKFNNADPDSSMFLKHSQLVGSVVRGSCMDKWFVQS